MVHNTKRWTRKSKSKSKSVVTTNSIFWHISFLCVYKNDDDDGDDGGDDDDDDEDDEFASVSAFLALALSFYLLLYFMLSHARSLSRSTSLLAYLPLESCVLCSTQYDLNCVITIARERAWLTRNKNIRWKFHEKKQYSERDRVRKATLIPYAAVCAVIRFKYSILLACLSSYTRARRFSFIILLSLSLSLAL